MKKDAASAAYAAGVRIIAVRAAIVVLVVGAAFSAAFALRTGKADLMDTVITEVSAPAPIIDNDPLPQLALIPMPSKPAVKRPAKRAPRAARPKPPKRKQVNFTHQMEASGG